MSRTPGIILFVFVLSFVGLCHGEIVRVTAKVTTLSDAETKETRSAGIQGKRFMVYGAAKGWYLIEATISGERKLVWIPATDVEIDWGRTKEGRVAGVPNTNTLKLEGGQWVQLAGIEVTRADTELTRQTLAWLKGLLEGKQVTLEFDEEFAKSNHGYTLAYVYVDGLFVNRALVEHGLAAPLTAYKTGGGRYASVFKRLEDAAKASGAGVWAVRKATETAPTTAEETPEQEEWTEPEQARTLSPAERMQWARNLVTEARVSGARKKTTRSEVADGEDTDNPGRVSELVWTKTLSVTVKNGWGAPLEGLSVRYELFGKSGATSDTVTVYKSGTFERFSLRPNESRTFTSEPVIFQGTESSSTGWVGSKFYGYRITYLLKGTTVKVDASPSSLAGFHVGQDVE
ncbi:MAG: thermonuclease family protein [Verrucomicrobia bacterium]|nr:thermonuclease family protein [Verrucomicrobiota bacterium]